MSAQLPNLVTVLESLAEPTRLRLLVLCRHGELTVKDLTEATGMSQPRISRHLRILVEAGVLERFRERHWVYYRLRFDGLGATLAQAALAQLSPGDTEVMADSRRLQLLLATRARELRDDSVRQTAQTEGHRAGIELSPPTWTRIELALNRLASRSLGKRGFGRLLDIGTGTGRMLRLFAADAESAEGIDEAEAMRVAARAALRKAGLGDYTIRDGDMYALPHEEAVFDTVTLGHVLTCAVEPWKVVSEASRVLKSGGHLLTMEVLPDGVPVEAWRSSLKQWLADAGLGVIDDEVLDLPDVTAVLNLSQRDRGIETHLELSIA